ncbi:MAG TPA: WbqC family protein [Candidatus Wunengus sp. YC60]|uniref:WbqC family protein n=1 Tax=Candidatus Wunengus sp. YC60 TaxID=3367697 RepID=UPI0040290DEE
MIVAIHQPQYLPWIGYFDKLDRADVFVLLDNVQYKKNEWQNRNRIRTSQGWQWITVPVLYNYPEKINSVKINNTIYWRRKHLNALVYNYSKAPFFKEHQSFFEETFSNHWEYLVEINVHIIKYLNRALGINKEIVLASRLSLSEEPTRRLVDICKHVQADTYLSGKDGAKYMNFDAFAQADIQVIFQDFHHPAYSQLHEPFETFMSVIDLLFNHGHRSMEIIRSRNRQ